MTNNDRPGPPDDTWGGDGTWASGDWAARPTASGTGQDEWGTRQFPTQHQSQHQAPAWGQQPPYQPTY